MTRTLTLILFVAGTMLMAAAADAAPAGKESMVLLPVANDPTVSFRIWFKVGSQNDPPGKEGLAALTGAMLTEASTRRTATRRSSTCCSRACSKTPTCRWRWCWSTP